MRSPDTYIGIFGHAKHGKSTLAGRILSELDAFSQEEFSKLKAEALILGKDFNPYNLAFLKRQSKTTIDESRTSFPERGDILLPNEKIITIVDTPGHEMFLDQTIYGAYLSDVAILTIEALEDIELGTINIFRLLKSFEIPIAAIAITKMDIVGYSETFYRKKCLQILSDIFEGDALLSKKIPIIPIDAISDFESGIKLKTNIEWYRGKTVIESIESVSNSFILPNEKTRFVIEGRKEVFNVEGLGTVVVGMLETGRLKVEDKLYLQPNVDESNENLVFTIRSIEYSKPINFKFKKDRRSDEVSARSIISVAINTNKINIEKLLRSGGVFSNEKILPQKPSLIEAEISFFEPKTVYQGKEFRFFTNGCSTTAIIYDTDINNIRSVYKRSSKEIVDATDFVEKIVRKVNLKFKTPIYLEFDPKFHRLTRFILKEDNKIVACGRCTKFLS